MSPSLRSFLANLAALSVIVAGFFFILDRQTSTVVPVQSAQSVATTSAQTAAAVVAATSTAPVTRATTTKAVVKKISPASKKQVVAQQPANQVTRIENPYPFAPLSSADVNAAARLALVNILCMPRGGGSLSPISGSGVIIDPRGVILTNAHVAQYVLLSQDPRVDLSCSVRTGAPAVAHFTPAVLYIPPVWVEAHAKEILTARPSGTGEHDYALLIITGSVDPSPLPASFPYLPYDTREGIGFQGDQVLVASYPAEFVGGIAAYYNLFPASSVTTIGQLITFGTNSIDLLSLGGVIEAQSGSSGGAVVNAWGRLIALISTTSDAATTAQRDLHALTLSYISRDLAAQSQFNLAAILGGDVIAQAQDFQTTIASKLVSLYLDTLSKPH